MARKVGSEDDATRTAAPSHSISEQGTSPSTPSILRLRERERYDIVDEHGRGGLGRVFRAHDRELGRDVALKELLQRGHAAELRFFREALVTARLEHPGIVPVHEAGRWPDGTPYYAMKLVGGRSLKALIDERATLAERIELLPNIIAVADAMAYAHDRQIIHRDLKPSNVMVGDFGETIVIDWGLAKALDDETPDIEEAPYRTQARDELTAAGSSLGTPAYMAPEQFGGRVDHRVDIYALGGLLYHVLAGVPPHQDVDSRTSDVPPLPRDVPEDLVAITRRAMARDRSARFPTAHAFAEDLRRFQRRDRVSARTYSLGARLGLAFARHRTVAVVAMFALIVLSVTLAISAITIARRRSEAVTAREAAEVSNAIALLERDPTRAWAALRDVPARPETALLRARIRAAGVADRIVQLPARFDRVDVTRDGELVVFSTADRSLSSLDTKTGSLIHLADGLTEPSRWSISGDVVYFVRQQPYLAVAAVALGGGPITELARLDRVPSHLDADDHRALWPDGHQLRSASLESGSAVVADGVEDFAVDGNDLALCIDGKLVAAADRRELGTCSRQRHVLETSAGFAYEAPLNLLQIFARGQRRVVETGATKEFSADRLTTTGLVVGTSGTNEGAFLRAGATQFERVQFGSRVIGSAARDDLAAWSLVDGSIEIRDIVSGREWRLQAHAETPWCLELLSRRRVLTCERREARIWTLPSDGATTIAKIPAAANNIVFNATHDALLDGNDGTSWVIAGGGREATAVHHHESTGFGAAWCGQRACTSGWDSTVICSDVAGGVSNTASFDGVTAWIGEGAGNCFTITTRGGVYDIKDPGHPLYRHDHEPYRIAVASDGSQLVSVDWGGDATLFDTRRHVVSHHGHLHEGLVSNVAWSDEQIVTTGVDGRFVVSSDALAPIHDWQLGAPIRYLSVAADIAGVGLDDGTLLIVSTRLGVLRRVATGGTFSSLAVAPDGAAVAAGTASGDVLIATLAGRFAAARFEHGRITCLGFESPSVLTLCAPSGRIIRVPLAALSFDSEAPTTTKQETPK